MSEKGRDFYDDLIYCLLCEMLHKFPISSEKNVQMDRKIGFNLWKLVFDPILCIT